MPGWPGPEALLVGRLGFSLWERYFRISLPVLRGGGCSPARKGFGSWGAEREPGQERTWGGASVLESGRALARLQGEAQGGLRPRALTLPAGPNRPEGEVCGQPGV